MQLQGLGEVELVGISQFLRQSKCANVLLEEVGGAVEVREQKRRGGGEAGRIEGRGELIRRLRRRGGRVGEDFWRGRRVNQIAIFFL